MSSGLREAKTALSRERAALRADMGLIEARLSALGKIEAANDLAAEIIRIWQAEREAKAKEAAPA